LYPSNTILAAAWYLAIELCPGEVYHGKEKEEIDLYRRINRFFKVDKPDVQGI
jgi:hypothetical protein